MKGLFFVLGTAMALVSCAQVNTASSDSIKVDSLSVNKKSMDSLELATFGSGCFWCVEAVFQDIKGVEKVTSGYSGGQIKNPSYKEVCAGTTGHANFMLSTLDRCQTSRQHSPTMTKCIG